MTLFMLITSDLQILINYISFTESLFILMSIASLLWLRYKDPKRHRPIKVQYCYFTLILIKLLYNIIVTTLYHKFVLVKVNIGI